MAESFLNGSLGVCILTHINRRNLFSGGVGSSLQYTLMGERDLRGVGLGGRDRDMGDSLDGI